MKAPTLAASAEYLLEVKKSRFLARAAPIDDPAAALAFLNAVADRTATHNCWAYRIGAQYRSSDDGEPGGSAGRPILAAIDGSGLDGVMVVVTRWFGGVKLGAGGLVRAYGGAAAECLRSAPRVAVIDWILVELHCEHALAAAVHALLRRESGEKVGEAFDAEGLVLRIRLPADRLDVLTGALRDASRGRARMLPVDATVDAAPP